METARRQLDTQDYSPQTAAYVLSTLGRRTQEWEVYTSSQQQPA